jgi:hypothetical protein
MLTETLLRIPFSVTEAGYWKEFQKLVSNFKGADKNFELIFSSTKEKNCKNYQRMCTIQKVTLFDLNF